MKECLNIVIKRRHLPLEQKIYKADFLQLVKTFWIIDVIDKDDGDVCDIASADRLFGLIFVIALSLHIRYFFHCFQTL